MAWIAAIAGAGIAAYSADRQRKAQREAQERARQDLSGSLGQAQAALGPWADIGRRQGLYRLAALMGDDRFGSNEAIDLYELKAPTMADYGGFTEKQLTAPLGLPDFAGQAFGDDINRGSLSMGYRSRRNRRRNDQARREYQERLDAARAKYQKEMGEYTTKKSALEAAIAKQKEDGTYRVGADYLFGSEAYKNRFDQGQRNMLRGLAASRGVLGGGQLKDLERFGQDYASNEFNNEYNRLANMAGLGQTAVTQTGQWGMGTGPNLANLALAGGNTLSNYYSDMNNIGQGTLGNVTYENQRRRQQQEDERRRSSYANGWSNGPANGWTT